MTRLRSSVALLFLVLTSTTAAADDLVAITLVKPGGGFLAADGSILPLEIVLRDVGGLVAMREASVGASAGQIKASRVAGDGRIAVLYATPKSKRAADVTFDVRAVRKDGSELITAQSLRIPPPETPPIELEIDPRTLTAGEPAPIKTVARLGGASPREISLFAAGGELTSVERDDGSSTLTTATAVLQPSPGMPVDAPSHLIVLAAASTARGFAARAAHLSVLAPIRVSTEIAPGAELVLTGTEDRPEPVRAPPDGKTVINGLARYGAPIKAFAVQGKKRTEIPVAMPSGLVPPGIAAAIPGQNVADGGTGPTLVVALPPRPFGKKTGGPRLTVEGAVLVDKKRIADDLFVLVLERPTEPTPVSVLADGNGIGTIELDPGFGRTIALADEPARGAERAALIAEVKDATGAPTDLPRPTARANSPGGAIDLDVERIAAGRWRISVPPKVKGDANGKAGVIVEIAAPPTIVGEPQELVQASRSIRLGGRSDAIRTEVPGGPSLGEEPPEPIVRRFGLSAGALAGSTLGSSQIVLGGAVLAEVRLISDRFAIRTGLEVFRASKRGTLRFMTGQDSAPAATLDTEASIGGVVVPFDAGFAPVSTGSFELMLRAGGAARFESLALDVAGGGTRTAFGAHLAVEAGLALGGGDLFMDVLIGGLGASTKDFPGPVSFEGNLAHVRLDLGYRLWL